MFIRVQLSHLMQYYVGTYIIYIPESYLPCFAKNEVMEQERSCDKEIKQSAESTS